MGGGPYDPVNPQGARGASRKSASWCLTANIADAGKLINAKVISRPSGQMPYETAGDLMLTFPDSASVENYRRDLNLDTAVATS